MVFVSTWLSRSPVIFPIGSITPINAEFLHCMVAFKRNEEGHSNAAIAHKTPLAMYYDEALCKWC